MNAGGSVSEATTGDHCSGRCGLRVCAEGLGGGSDGSGDGLPHRGRETSDGQVSEVVLPHKEIQCPCFSQLSLLSSKRNVSSRQVELSTRAPLGPSSHLQEDRRRALTDMSCENNEPWISNFALRLLEHVRDNYFQENVEPPLSSSQQQSLTSPASSAAEERRPKCCWLSSLWASDDVSFLWKESFPSPCVCKVTPTTLPSRSSLRLTVRASLMLSSVQLSNLVPDVHCDSSALHGTLVSAGVRDITNHTQRSTSVASKVARPVSQNTTPVLQDTSPPLQAEASQTRKDTTLSPPITRCKLEDQRGRECNSCRSVAWPSPDNCTVRTRRPQRVCVSSASVQESTRARSCHWSRHLLTSVVLVVALLASATTAYELKRKSTLFSVYVECDYEERKTR